jgi:hypothetical protein
MKRFVLVILGIVVSAGFAAKIATQTDWHDGPGNFGPEHPWGIEFDNSIDINYLYQFGRISLAAQMDDDPTQHQIDVYNREGAIVQTGDMDGDEDIDVVIGDGANTYVVWYENLGEGNFDPAENVIYARGWTNFTLADVNQDGFTDVLTNDDNRIWVDLNNHSGGFTRYEVGTCADGDCIGAADFDADGDVDVIGSAYQNNDLAWFENDGSSKVFTRHLIMDRYYGQAEMPHVVADFDADGDIDFASINNHSSGRHLHWWENDLDNSSSFIQHSIDESYGSRRIYGYDMDRDGDMDLITTHSYTLSLDWWENDGSGNFTQRNISTTYDTRGSSADYGAGVTALDLNWDGAIDIITSSYRDNTLDWWKNDGNMNFTQNTFATGYSNGTGVWIDDISGNGFYDVVSAARANRADWWDLFDHFADQGELVSPVYDAKIYALWNRLETDGLSGNGTDIKFLIRAGNNPAALPDWSTVDTVGGGASLKTHVDQYTQYMQYKVILSTTDPDYSPFVHEVRLLYLGGDIGVTRILIPYDTAYCENEEYEYYPKVEVSNLYPDDVASDPGKVIAVVDSAGVIVYSDTASVGEIGAGEDDLISFHKPWVPKLPGDFTYLFYAYTEMDNDHEAHNDSLGIYVYCVDGQVGITEVPGLDLRLRIAGNRAYYSLPDNTTGFLNVFDAAGRRVQSHEVSRAGDIDITGAPAGLYFLRLQYDDDAVVGKVVITN